MQSLLQRVTRLQGDKQVSRVVSALGIVGFSGSMI